MRPSLFPLLLLFLLAGMPGHAIAQGPHPEGAGTFETLLAQETRRLDQAMGARMGVALMRTDDPVVQAFISSGVLRVPEEAYVRLESGLAAVAVMDGSHNGQKRPMCYVLFNPDRAGPSQRAFFDPIALATGDSRQGAAYLAAHEVAHCLDRLEREAALGRHMRWNAAMAREAGVAPPAFARVFGQVAATAAYRSRQMDLHADLAQRQYEERVADAFGVLWTWRLGGARDVLEKVREVRARETVHNAHATAPALDLLPSLEPALARAENIDQVWALARQVQRQAGIDPSLGPGSTVARNPMADVFKPGRSDPRPRQIPAPPQPRAWNELPRFGAPGRK